MNETKKLKQMTELLNKKLDLLELDLFKDCPKSKFINSSIVVTVPFTKNISVTTRWVTNDISVNFKE